MGSGVASIFKAGESGKASSVNTAGALLYGRVYNILLSDKEDEYTKAGIVPGSIGAIQFKFIVKGLEDLNPTTQIAYPFDPRTRAFPVKNEVVEIVSGPSNDIKDAETNNLQVYYYKSVVDMWNSPEHNARPNSQFNQKKEQVTGEFVEKGNVGRLMHLPGDYVLEGRSGNGIRVGSSNNKSKAKSPWTGPDSSPLIVISNGRKSSKLSFEDINKDGSSIYILSDQSITFNPASLNFESYDANMTPVQAAQVVTPEPAKVEAPLAVVPPVEPPVEKPADVPTKKEELIKDEVEALPDQESVNDEEFQEYENEVVIGTTQLGMQVSSKPIYIIQESSISSQGIDRIISGKVKPVLKGAFSKLIFKDFKSTPKTIADFVKELNILKDSGQLNINVARSLLAIAINEQSGTRGFNNNFFGIHSDIGGFSRAGKFPNSNPDHQVFAREGGTRQIRGYLGFTEFKTALLYIADVLYAKGFDTIPYGQGEADQFTRFYIDKWWSPVNKNVSQNTFNSKRQGYLQAINLIK